MDPFDNWVVSQQLLFVNFKINESFEDLILINLKCPFTLISGENLSLYNSLFIFIYLMKDEQETNILTAGWHEVRRTEKNQ